jgi:EPS-associated MarR family transcriptional regulator
MNNNKIDILETEKILHILKEIEANPYITQRYLSQKYLVSLGKTNFLIKALVVKGIIKINNFKNSKNKLSYIYQLTPEGIKEKVILTHKFLTRKLEEYERLKEEIELLKSEANSTLPEQEPV